jgi:glycosyltransferase involved in cell wall biosynthesis
VKEELQPKIVLLMLTFNHSDCLKKSINDILSQTYPNFTLKIVDDCSEDDSFEIAKRFEALDSRVRVFKNTRNLGMFENFESNLLQLFKEDNFDFFGWLGPDDEWSDIWLETLVNLQPPEDKKGLRQSFVTYKYQSDLQIRQYSDISSKDLSFKESKELRKGYGELMHGLWDRRTVESIIQDSHLVPFKYLLKLENLFISLLIEKGGFITVEQPLHTKQKALGSRNRYQQNYFFQNPDRILLTAVKALPGLLQLLKDKKKNFRFVLGSFLIDLRVALPRKVKI